MWKSYDTKTSPYKVAVQLPILEFGHRLQMTPRLENEDKSIVRAHLFRKNSNVEVMFVTRDKKVKNSHRSIQNCLETPITPTLHEKGDEFNGSYQLHALLKLLTENEGIVCDGQWWSVMLGIMEKKEWLYDSLGEYEKVKESYWYWEMENRVNCYEIYRQLEVDNKQLAKSFTTFAGAMIKEMVKVWKKSKDQDEEISQSLNTLP